MQEMSWNYKTFDYKISKKQTEEKKEEGYAS